MKKTLVAVALLAGGIAFLSVDTTKEGCGARCCRRPDGAPVEACVRRHPTTGALEDVGDATIPATHAVGAGCVPTECVVGLGIEVTP